MCPRRAEWALAGADTQASPLGGSMALLVLRPDDSPAGLFVAVGQWKGGGNSGSKVRKIVLRACVSSSRTFGSRECK